MGEDKKIGMARISKTPLNSMNFGVSVLVILMAVYPLIPLLYAFSPKLLPLLYNFTRWSFFMVLALIALVIVFISNIKSSRKLNFQLPTIFLFLFLTAMAISAFFSIHQTEVWLGDPAYMTGFVTHVGFATLFFLAKEVTFHKTSDIEKIVTIWLVSAALIALVGLLQYFGFNILPFGSKEIFEPTASYSTLLNPNDLGSYLVMAFPFAAHRFLQAYSVKTFLFVALIYGATLTSLTRGAWVGLLAGGLFLFYLYPKKKNLVYLLVTLFLVTVMLLPFNDWKLYYRINTFAQETEKALEGDPETGASRFLLWQEGVKALPQSILMGTGPDTYFYISPEKFEEGFSNPKIARKAHNLHLEYAITIGMPGLTFFLLFILSIIIKTNIRDAFHVVLLSMVIIHLVRGFFLVDVLQVYPLFWVLMGFYAGLAFNSKGHGNLTREY